MHRMVVIASLAFCLTAHAQDMPPLEAYGKLPMYDMFEMSPSGKLAASRVTYDNVDSVMIMDVDQVKFITGADATNVNPRSLNFVYDDKLILVAGTTVRSRAVRGAYDFSAAFVLDLEGKGVRQLLRGARGLYPHQSGLGRIIGIKSDEPVLYMPAYTGDTTPAYSVYEVQLENSRAKTIERGNRHTTDFFVNGSGEVFIRVDFDDEKNVTRIHNVEGGSKKSKLIYEEEAEIPTFGLVGVTQSRDALVLLTSSSKTGGYSYFLMSVEDGSITGPIFEKEGHEIEWVVTDINRVVYGVEFAGFTPTYAFFDKSINDRVNTVQERLPGISAQLVSWNQDFSRMIFEVSGNWSAGAYVMFEDVYAQPKMLGASRPEIAKEFIAPIEITEYTARDGLTIPALVTARQDVREAGGAPTIVLPHGGPASHDVFGFDWMAQYFASRGYVVLQPQFRGSDGFGHDHSVAGNGEWGGKMQTDIDDGVLHLIETGITDPSRVCIVGASYGGYAALAAGAFSPDMYRCVVALAAVTDIPRMLRRERNQHGSRHWVIDYFEKLYGAEASEKDYLNAISPARHAESFQAPVLLLHGKNDTVVNIDQSNAMYKALRKADKDVKFIKLKGEDHWLTQEATRIETLRAMSEFIHVHL